MKLRLLAFSCCFAFSANISASYAQYVDLSQIGNQPHRPKNVRDHYFQGDIEIQVSSDPRHLVDLRNGDINENTMLMLGPAPAPRTSNTIIKVSPPTSSAPSFPFVSNISNPASPHILPKGSNYSVMPPYSPQKQPGYILASPSIAKSSKFVSQSVQAKPISTYGTNSAQSTNTLSVKTEVKGKLNSPGTLLHKN